jgi:hypothetical protein
VKFLLQNVYQFPLGFRRPWKYVLFDYIDSVSAINRKENAFYNAAEELLNLLSAGGIFPIGMSPVTRVVINCHDAGRPKCYFRLSRRVSVNNAIKCLGVSRCVTVCLGVSR